MKLEVPRSGAATEPSKLPDGPPEMKIPEQQPERNGRPEQPVIVHVKCGPKIHTKKVSNYATVRQLKTELLEAGVVTFTIDEFKLQTVKKEEGAVNKTVLLEDESHELFLYGFQHEANLTVIGPHIRLNIVDTEGKTSSRIFSRWSSLQELKNILASMRHFDFFMFVKRRADDYRKLDTVHDILLDHVLTDDDTVYLSKNDFFRDKCQLYFEAVKFRNMGFGHETVSQCKVAYAAVDWRSCEEYQYHVTTTAGYPFTERSTYC